MNQRYAAIDVGTNSIKMVVMERDQSGQWRVVADRLSVPRLGQGLSVTGKLKSSAMDRATAAIRWMADEAKTLGVDGLIAVGTLALRRSDNAVIFIDQVKHECGVSIEVITGEEEALLSFLGAAAGTDVAGRQAIVIDIGGGSTEVTLARDSRIQSRESYSIGAVSLTEDHLHSDPPCPAEIKAAEKILTDILLPLGRMPTPELLIGVGGTLTTLASVHYRMTAYDPVLAHGTVFRPLDLEEFVRRFATVPLAHRKDIPGLPPERADIILAGTLIVQQVMQVLRASAITVSDWGLRHGLILSRYGTPPEGLTTI